MVKCPKCKSEGSNIVLVEIWDGAALIFNQRDDGLIETEGWTSNKSNPTSVNGNCKCGHKWKIRGVTQIIDIPGYINKY